MSEIDWSKAPEGATHYNAEIRCFVSKDGLWHGGVFTACKAPDFGSARFIPRPAAPVSWDGTGLPPVGTVCEIWDDSPHECYAEHVGKTITVLAHDVMYGDPVAVYAIDTKKGRRYHALVAKCFRPIRTPEQIAAEEREKAVAAIKAIADAAIYRGESAAAAVYDAGYRRDWTVRLPKAYENHVGDLVVDLEDAIEAIKAAGGKVEGGGA